MNRPLALLLLCLAACASRPAPGSATPAAQAAPSAAPAEASGPAPAASDAPLPEPAPTPAPAPPPPPPPAQATPPLPASGPLPEVQDAGLGYATPETALAALIEKPGVKVIQHDGWTTVQDEEAPGHTALWSFTPPGHPAHPAMIKRVLFEQDGAVWMTMAVRCDGGKSACDALVRQFQDLNDSLTRATREHVRKGTQAGAPTPAANTAQPAPAPTNELAQAAPAPADDRAAPGLPPPPAPPGPGGAAEPAEPAVDPDLWKRTLERQCPGQQAADQYAPLLAGFERTLPPGTRIKAEHLADVAHRLEAYRKLGLLHRFVVYACGQPH